MGLEDPEHGEDFPRTTVDAPFFLPSFLSFFGSGVGRRLRDFFNPD